MNDQLPLSALLSQALVAFIIEFDNEFEHQAPHRTTRNGTSPGHSSAPWLVSMVIWLKFMRHIPSHGISASELMRRAGLSEKEMRIWLPRLSRWWGYLIVEPVAPARPSHQSVPHWLIRPTAGGQAALDVWRPLSCVIEKRWNARFGENTVNSLRQTAQALVNHLNHHLPDSLPILGYGLFSEVSPLVQNGASSSGDPSSPQSLPILLSKILLAFALEFERRSGLSLAISANILRLVGDNGTRTRDLPRLSGVSKEAVAMALGRLEERGLTCVESAPAGSRGKTLVLSPIGHAAREIYPQLTESIEDRWKTSFGDPVVTNLRRCLEILAGGGTPKSSPLFRGLTPYPKGWRASVRKPEILPHYPMILHRGGFPDGS